MCPELVLSGCSMHVWQLYTYKRTDSYLGTLLVTFGTDTEKTTQEEVGDFQLGVDVRKSTDTAKDLGTIEHHQTTDAEQKCILVCTSRVDAQEVTHMPQNRAKKYQAKTTKKIG